MTEIQQKVIPSSQGTITVNSKVYVNRTRLYIAPVVNAMDNKLPGLIKCFERYIRISVIYMISQLSDPVAPGEPLFLHKLVNSDPDIRLMHELTSQHLC